MNQVDEAGGIWLLAQREDIRGVTMLKSLCISKQAWRREADIVFALIFGMQLYYAPSICYWAAAFLATNPDYHTEATVKGCITEVSRAWKGIKRKSDGSIGSVGSSMTKNPSERVDGTVRYMKLIKRMDAVRVVARRISERSHPVLVADMLQCLNALAPIYDDAVCYKNLRLIRSIVAALGGVWADTEACWKAWRSMSTHVTRKCKELCIYQYEDAVIIRDALRKHCAKYSFADLICYTCLMK
jgi:hypothetical protein